MKIPIHPSNTNNNNAVEAVHYSPIKYNKSPHFSTDNSSTEPTSNTATAPETSKPTKPTTAVALGTVPIVFDSVNDGFPSMINPYLHIHYIMQENIEYR